MEFGKDAVALVAVVGALITIYHWVVKPLNAILSRLNRIEGDTADLIGDRLNEAYVQVMQLGWCTRDSKDRLSKMHNRYSSLGRNHLMDNYIKNIIKLPERPPNEEC